MTRNPEQTQSAVHFDKIGQIAIRVDDLAKAFALLTEKTGVTVSRNGASFLRIDTNAENVPDLNALLVAHGVKVYELTPDQESLEEAFLRLTALPQKENR